MLFRERFDCLWCGAPWTTRGRDDLEGWAQLCPSCLGKAGSNAFLRGRLRAGIAARAGASPAGISPAAGSPAGAAQAVASPAGGAPGSVVERPRPPVATAFPDDWFLRRGPFERGAIHDAAWAAELDVVTRWLDELQPAGRIEEPGAGGGFFSPLLATKGELHASDADGAALDRARERLLAHGLRAHLHVADPWAVPDDGAADAVVAAFLLGRVRGAGLDAAVGSLRRRLRTGGRLALVELRPDPAGGPPAGTPWTWHDPDLVAAAIVRAGFGDVRRTETGRFFGLLGAVAR